MTTKVCTKCGVEKEFEAFHKKAKGRVGRVGQCKACIAAYGKLYRVKFRDVKSQSDKNYREKNKEALKIKQKEYALKNRERICDRAKKWQRDNPEAFKARRNKWTAENKDRVNDYKKQWMREKRETDPCFYLTQIVMAQVNKALFARGGNKPKRTSEYIGCDWDALLIHIERQFTDGMSWDNRGEWHVDHIIPLATANTVEDVIPLLHFTNLRPLWAKDNLEKGDTRLLLI